MVDPTAGFESHDDARGASRRNFLRYGGLAVGALAGAFGGLAPGGFARPAYGAEGVNYLDRSTFDDWDKEYHTQNNPGQPDQPNDTSNNAERSGTLSWSQSYVLAGFIRMYEAYGDTYYLDRLIHNADLVLSVRDSERGVVDYRRKSLPAWRANHPYTAGAIELADERGKPTLEVRSALPYADTTTVTVEDGTKPDAFTLRLTNERYRRTETFADLTMDPSSPNYAPGKLYWGYHQSGVRISSRDLRSTPNAAGKPTTGRYRMVSQPVIFTVHTGMITYPMASFARIVLHTPKLRRNPYYRAKAEKYLDALRAAVAVHDPEWRENDAGEGYYAWPKGTPLAFDGCEQPINQSLGLGQTITELAAATGEKSYQHRAAAMARMFARQLDVDNGGAYVWHYWPEGGLRFNGYNATGSQETDVSVYTPATTGGAQQFDDVSHGAISVEFAVRAFRERLGFRGLDMARLARTFAQNLATTHNGRPATSLSVNGAGVGSSVYAHQTPRWMLTTPWDDRIFNHSLALYDRYQPTPDKLDDYAVGFGYLLAGVANLNWGNRRLSEK